MNADGSLTRRELELDARIDREQELLRRADWVRADHRQPALYEPVLIYDDSADEAVWLGWLTPTGWHVIEGATALNVTHWAARPLGPGR